MYFTTKKFWKDTIERTVWTMAEAFCGLVGVNALTIADASWGIVLSATGLTGIMTIARCLATKPQGIDAEG